MKVLSQEYEHPTQVSRVRLQVFEVPGEGYLVTEDRIGTVTVVATLGLFSTREAALRRLDSRGRELMGQRYRPVAPAA
jgi:hypothetical protein